MAQGQNETVHLILVGYIGSGKSSTGNTIAKKREFNSGTGSVRITKEVKRVKVPFPNINLMVYDTPGLQAEGDFDQIKKEINKIAPPKVTYAFVVRIGRISKEELKILESLMKRKKELLKNSILIFTNAKELLNEDNITANHTFDTWLADVPSLRKIVADYKINHIKFENMNATEEEKTSDVTNLCTMLNIPFDRTQSVQKSPLTDLDTHFPDDGQEEAMVFVTKDKLRSKFGNEGELFFETEYKLQSETQLYQ